MKITKKGTPLQTITVGIPAYNSQENIAELLRSLLAQDQTTFKLVQVVVISDASKDKTILRSKQVSDPHHQLKIIDARKRTGMANLFSRMLKLSKTDIFVLLNDDIKISDPKFLSRLIRPFSTHANIGIVSGNPRPNTAKNFIQQAGISTFNAYDQARYSFKSGHNKFTCNGKALALSKKFILKLKLPKDKSIMANVDSYLYFRCLQLKLKYFHARSAKIYFDYPDNLDDYIKWISRDKATDQVMEHNFGSLASRHQTLPTPEYFKAVIIETIKNPLGCIYIFSVGLYCRLKSYAIAQNFNPTWEVITSTKRALN